MPLHPRSHPRARGFTLIESLIALSCLGILACIAYGLLAHRSGSHEVEIAAYMKTHHKDHPYDVSCKSMGALTRRCDVSLVGTTRVIALTCDITGCAEAKGVLQP